MILGKNWNRLVKIMTSQIRRKSWFTRMYGTQVVQIGAMHLGQENMKMVLEWVQFWKQMVITIGSIFTCLPYMEWMPRLDPHLCGGPLSIIYYPCSILFITSWDLKWLRHCAVKNSPKQIGLGLNDGSGLSSGAKHLQLLHNALGAGAALAPGQLCKKRQLLIGITLSVKLMLKHSHQPCEVNVHLFLWQVTKQA